MQVERVRRLNEPREDTPLCEPRGCAACGFLIEGGGLSLGKRWLHLGCIEDYVVSLERARDRAIEDNTALRAAADERALPKWIVGGAGGGGGAPAGVWTAIPGGWQMVTNTGNVTVAANNLTFASNPTIDFVSQDFWSGPAVSYRGLITTSTTGLGSEKALGP